LNLDVLRIAVKKYGQRFDLIYRGVRSNRPDCEYKIMFGSTDIKVASFYGTIKEYRNIFGLRTTSTIAKSVVTNDYDKIDEEIIFFPNNPKNE
jgi:hypothetical protein